MKLILHMLLAMVWLSAVSVHAMQGSGLAGTTAGNAGVNVGPLPGGPAGPAAPGAGPRNRNGNGLAAPGKNKKESEAFKKWELPAAEKAVELDTASFDAVYESLKLSSAQFERIAALRLKLAQEGAVLVAAQEQARQGYDKAEGEAAATGWAQRVMTAGEALKRFDPNLKFASGLAGILTQEQLKAWQTAAKR